MADEEPGLPVKLGPVSNGEFVPVPHSPTVAEAIRRTHQLADVNARRLGISRRRFLTGATGAAATFFVLAACSKEEARSRGEEPGGTYDVSEEATLDTDAALEELGGGEFIFDVQSHYVNQDLAQPGGEWTSAFPHAACPEGAEDANPGRASPSTPTSGRCSSGPTRRWRSCRPCRRRPSTGCSPATWSTPSTWPPASAATAGS
ncbi:hypothetical protein HC251_00310 [Iamia sp. SCSIO 61187]|uniref:hypothetical protein n=1 Tax=Iamia sp. SCSIO 61187 TaxID=2722752 RepID=UPI001C6365D3|nr:hypothetical protein [Iamia sp. SCSIO 61187]QYG91025.1 hypothetical protein HC251_00310 [Iamia sp. SCSIO 61187]